MASKKINFFIIIFLIIFFFIILLNALKKENVYVPKISILQEIPNFNVKIFETNEKYEFTEILSNKGHTIVNIWSSWCLPCRDEHKYLIMLSKLQSVQIIGINYKDKINNAKKFIREYQNPYDVILSDDEGLNSIQLGAYGVPETFIIKNSDRKIVKKYIGPINEKFFKEINTIIKK